MTNKYTPDIDHLTEGLAHVPEQYRGKPKLGAWWVIFLRQLELIHKAFEAIPTAFDLDVAVGWRLDWVGVKVGQRRRGSDDDKYRRWIRARIRANRSIGKNEDLLAVAGLLLTTYTYRADTDSIRVWTSDLIDQEDAKAIVELLQAASPLSQVQLYYSTERPFIRRTTLSTVDDTGYSEVGAFGGGAVTALVVAADRV